MQTQPRLKIEEEKKSIELRSIVSKDQKVQKALSEIFG